jgi:hypothetical protein
MPKIFEYLGILIFFYSNEHDPVHVHAKYNNFENRAEFILLDGKIIEIKIKLVKGRKPLPNNKLIDFKEFLKKYSEKIVEKWVDYFVYHKEVKFEKINTRLK